MKCQAFKAFLRLCLGFGLSAVLLTLIQVPLGWAPLAWFALVPFILTCRPDARSGPLLSAAWLVGTLYWLGNTYWVSYVATVGYFGLAIFLGLYWLLLAWCLRWCRRRGWPLWITVAVLFTGAEAWQSVLLTGFSWRFLAHSQYASLPLIQIADTFGALGVSFLVAMVNGLLADLFLSLRRKKLLAPRNFILVGLVGSLIMFAMIYGQFRLDQVTDRRTARHHLRPGPVVGSIQSNIPSAVKEVADNGPKILANMINLSEQAYKAGASILVWPETIVLAAMNSDYLDFCAPDSYPRTYDTRIRELVYDRGRLLFGAHSAVISLEGPNIELIDQYNSAFLYNPQGMPAEKRYDKIHLVPFGEYIPFYKRVLSLSKKLTAVNPRLDLAAFLDRLSPYGYLYNLTPGDEFTLFEAGVGSETWHFGTLICYEDTVAPVARRMVYDPNGHKKADWLFNISNDGWYVKYRDGKVIPSGELPQRTVISVFRAVENRIPIVRSVNAGISCVIDSTGRIRDSYLQGTLPRTAMWRQGVEGWFTDRITIDSRRSLFGRTGRWFDGVCGFALLIILILTFRGKSRKLSQNQTQ